MSSRTDYLSEDDTLTENEYRNRLRELSPSAKLVAKVLETDAPLSQTQLANEYLLPARTVRHAINQLEDANLVDSQRDLRDARKILYHLEIR